VLYQPPEGSSGMVDAYTSVLGLPWTLGARPCRRDHLVKYLSVLPVRRYKIFPALNFIILFSSVSRFFLSCDHHSQAACDQVFRILSVNVGRGQ
jgi:hypothetical protein